ncbi:MAG: UDP-galactopyranose mutase [Verrucomicrobiota bacterium]|jgi:UDP-galactopyranose mutase
MNVDYLVVGSGLTGSTIARLLIDHQREVLMLERRLQPGGNVRDFMHPARFRVHTYGPHYFRCSSLEVWEFVNRFSSFYPYRASIKAKVAGQYWDWPLSQTLLDQYPGWESPRHAGTPSDFEEACLRKMPRSVYETFIKGYTRRQWGVEPRRLAPDLADRIRINGRGQVGLAPHCLFQVLPAAGYSQLMANMIAGIPCRLGVDYLQDPSEYRARKALIYTGPIDAFFQFDAGRLSYRAQKRIHQFLPHCDRYQPCAQVNHADEDDHGPLRTLEWKHLLPPAQQQPASGTLITREYPFTPQDPDEFEYPVPTPHNAQLYELYRQRAQAVPKLTVCGRLGSYCYLDMDGAIGVALGLAKQLLQQSTTGIPGGSGPAGPG